MVKRKGGAIEILDNDSPAPQIETWKVWMRYSASKTAIWSFLLFLRDILLKLNIGILKKYINIITLSSWIAAALRGGEGVLISIFEQDSPSPF